MRPLPKWPDFGDFVMPGLDRDVGVAASHWMFESFTHVFSPYQFTPHDWNRLRVVLNAVVDFDQLKRCRCTNLFLAATDVRSGKVRIFRNRDMSIEAVLSSAALPFLFKAVEIEGEFYWDGGYMGYP